VNFKRVDQLISNREKSVPSVSGKLRNALALSAMPLLLLQFSQVHAQEYDGQSFSVGATSLTPELRLDYVSVDNSFNSPDDPTDATGLILRPSFRWQADRRLLRLSSTYSGNYGRYSEDALDFTDHDLSARIDAAPSSKHRTIGEISFTRETDEFGTGQGALVPDLNEKIVKTNFSFDAGYSFGAKNARGNVGGGLSVGSTSYNDVGTITDGDDFSSVRPYGFFSYRLSVDTRLRAEIRYGVLDYDEDRRDRDAISFLVGADFAATDRTGGRVRFGTTRSDFDAQDVSDTTTVVADVNMYFRPRSFSRFDLVLNRDFQTVDDAEDGVGESVVDNITLSWSHDWTGRFSTRARLDTDRIDRDCPNIDTVTNQASLEFGVNIRRWLSVGAGVGTTRRTADVCDASVEPDSRDYERNSVSIHLKATL